MRIQHQLETPKTVNLLLQSEVTKKLIWPLGISFSCVDEVNQVLRVVCDKSLAIHRVSKQKRTFIPGVVIEGQTGSIFSHSKRTQL